MKIHQTTQLAIYDVQYAMNGKKIFSEQWLKKRFSLLFEEEIIIDADTANKAILDAGLVKPNE